MDLQLDVDAFSSRVETFSLAGLDPRGRKQAQPDLCGPSELSRTLSIQKEDLFRRRTIRRGLKKTKRQSNLRSVLKENEQRDLDGYHSELDVASIPDGRIDQIPNVVEECPSLTDDCPSLTSGSTVSSRNPSTRSSRSDTADPAIHKQYLCAVSGCGEYIRDAYPHLLLHQSRDTLRCPFGFCDDWDHSFTDVGRWMCHAIEHYFQAFPCGYCDGSKSLSSLTFARYDQFLRHLRSHFVAPISHAGGGLLSDRGSCVSFLNDTAKPTRATAPCLICSHELTAAEVKSHMMNCFMGTVFGQFHRVFEREATVEDNMKVSGRAKNSHDPCEASLRSKQSASPSLQKSHVCDICNTRFLRPGALHTHILSHTAEKSFHHGSIHESFDGRQKSVELSSLGRDQPVDREDCSVRRSRSVSSRFDNNLASVEDFQSRQTCPRTSGVPHEQSAFQDQRMQCPSPTTSAEMHTSEDETDWTEDISPSSPQSGSGDDIPQVKPLLSPVKQQIVDVLMDLFHRQLGSQFGVQTHQGGSNESAGGSFNSSNSSSSAPGRKRKGSRGSRGNSPPPPDDGNGQDPNKRRKPDGKSAAQETTPDLRFACPYYKRNPGRHQTFTSCRDPGFATVARLKEHLYRRHLLPIQCHRCCSTFDAEPLLREHQRDPRGCEIREQVPLEGFDKEQERKLKSKKRSMGYQTEEEKWKGVYRILFPDDSEEDMPSPYCEYQTKNRSGDSDEPSNVARFQEFSRLELPRLVRRTLEAAVQKEAQPLEEKLKDQLVEIVRECQNQLFSMFQQSTPSLYSQPSTTTLDSGRISNPAPVLLSPPSISTLDSGRISNNTSPHNPMGHAGSVTFSMAPPTAPALPPTYPAVYPVDESTKVHDSDSPDSGYNSGWGSAMHIEAWDQQQPLPQVDYQDQGGYDLSMPSSLVTNQWTDFPLEEQNGDWSFVDPTNLYKQVDMMLMGNNHPYP